MKKKKNMNKLLSFLLVFCMLLSTLMVSGGYIEAATNNGNDSIDAVLVLDFSGSVSGQEENIRNAAKLFVDMMAKEGSRIALVPFDDKVDMTKVLQLTPIESNADRDDVKRIIDTYSKGNDTDIGLALDKAIDIIGNASQKPGNRPMILLFTDGKIDFSVLAKSHDSNGDNGKAWNDQQVEAATQRATTATNRAVDLGIPVYTVGMTGSSGADEIFLENISNVTEAKSIMVSDWSELPTVYSEIFADFIGSELDDSIPELTLAGDTPVETKFNIPHSKVLEANIVMFRQGTGRISDIVFIDPGSGEDHPIHPMTDGNPNATYSTSGNYDMVKIVAPAQGEWTVRVYGDSGVKVKVNLLFNYNISLEAKIEVDDSTGGISAQAYLVDGNTGAPITEPEIYDGMSGKLYVMDQAGNVSYVNMDYHVDQQARYFESYNDASIPLNEMVTVWVETSGNGMNRESEKMELSYSGPTAPTISSIALLPPTITLNGLIPQLAKEHLDLNDYFAAGDPNYPVNYSIEEQGTDKIVNTSLNDSDLTLTGSQNGTTSLTVTATVGEAAVSQTTEIVVKATIGNVLYLIVAVVAVLLLIIILVIVLSKKPKKLKGILYWNFQDEDGYVSASQQEEFNLTFAKSVIQVNSIVTELALAYSGLEQIEIAGAKRGINIRNKGKKCRLLDMNGGERKKMSIGDGGMFSVTCQTEDGETTNIMMTYQMERTELI